MGVMSRRSDDTRNANSRPDRILRLLQETGLVSIHQLCNDLDVSIATVRRDLRHLENQNLLRRTHGGATCIEPLLYEPFRRDSSFQEQIERCSDEKRKIALAAAELVEDGDTIAMTAGTTTTLVARSIRQRQGVTVVTNTVNIAMELSKRKDLAIFVTGGHLRGDWFSLVGSAAVQAMTRIYVEKVFIGVNGIDAEKGLTCFNPEEAALNRTMIQQARKKIVVADHTKLGLVTSCLICPLREADILITDSGATDKAIEPFVQNGLEVRRV